ncbi:hypothetical protein EV44_g3432 [Erysiphe necator]|uniref:Uncharacterized protein n=1 Tax=Uncinula necator TaxID=52586 RepID=A0A0B1PEU8_UNCNE|nr:hypothetical protein EV44_g3432 [Erysiphe necator]
MSSNRLCTTCLQSQPSSNFLKNVVSNTYFKTCSTCRNRAKARRRNTHHRSPFEPAIMQAEEAEPNINNQVIVVDNILNDQCPGNENLMNENSNLADRNAALYDPPINISENSNFIHCKGCKKNCHPDLFHDPIRNRSFKQCTDCRRRDFNRRHPESLQDQPNSRPQHPRALPFNPPTVAPFNAAIDTAYIHCRMCRLNYPSESFANAASNSLYATCSECRSIQHARRYPTVFEPTPNQVPSNLIEDVDNSNDEEVEQLAANIGMFEIVEEEVFNGPVPEEAPTGDDPIFMISQLQSREFRNHDEIQRRLQADEEAFGISNPDEALQVDDDIIVSEIDPNIDPFLEELPPPEIDNENLLENEILNDPFVEENFHAQNNG